MSRGDQGPRPPRNLLDRLTEWLLRLMVPADLREPFAGDLLEESERFIAPERGRWRARLWLWGQIIRSLPVLLARPQTGEREPDIRRGKLIFATVWVLLGLLQAWDSRVFEASPIVVGIVLVAVALPTAESLLRARLGTFWLSMVLGFLLLVMARAISTTPLPDLFLILLPAGFLGAIVWTRQKKAGGTAA